MEIWNSIDSLKSLSHSLMWATVTFAILAALATGIRFYVDRRAGELSSEAKRTEAENKEKLQREREAALKLQVESAQRDQQEAHEKLLKVEQSVKGRHLTFEQSSKLKKMVQQTGFKISLIKVTAANSNNESQVYATEFVEAFKGGGCESILALPIPGLTPDVRGIHIGVREPSNVSTGALELSKMLSGIGVEFRISPIKPDFFREDTFILIIGGK
jgi:flagellar biosynthesis component FlhA